MFNTDLSAVNEDEPIYDNAPAELLQKVADGEIDEDEVKFLT